jgi:scyllo-inositol 2-dehydrogenase (NADP+)
MPLTLSAAKSPLLERKTVLADDTKLVVVGYGMGGHHAKLIKSVDGLSVYGVCDMNPEARARAASDHPDAKLYSDYEDVLSDDSVDAVIIVTPHNVHANMAIAAMEKGKHAITDKAMCLTVEEAEAMMAARDRAGVILSVFHNRRWDSDFLTVKKVLQEGLIGRLYHIESCVTAHGKPGGWRTNREAMGGWLFDWGAHTIDQILTLANSRAKHVYAFTHHRYEEPEEVEDYVNCTVTFENGMTATTVIGYINKIPMPRWYVMGQTGALVCDDFNTPVRMKTDLNGIPSEVTVPQIKGDWKSFYQNIADTLAGREELAVKPEQLVPQIAIAQAAYESIQAEQVVRL